MLYEQRTVKSEYSTQRKKNKRTEKCPADTFFPHVYQLFSISYHRRNNSTVDIV